MAKTAVTTKQTRKKAQTALRVTARLNNLRIAPRKMRLMAQLVRNLPVDEAVLNLKYRTERAARPLEKLLQSAIANAVHNNNLVRTNLKIAEVLVDPGMTIKRFQPRAQGRAYPIHKRSCHVTLTVTEIEPGQRQNKKTGAGSVSEIKTTKNTKVAEQAQTTPVKAEKTANSAPGTTPINKSNAGAPVKSKGFAKRILHRRGNM